MSSFSSDAFSYPELKSIPIRLIEFPFLSTFDEYKCLRKREKEKNPNDSLLVVDKASLQKIHYDFQLEKSILQNSKKESQKTELTGELSSENINLSTNDHNYQKSLGNKELETHHEINIYHEHKNVHQPINMINTNGKRSNQTNEKEQLELQKLLSEMALSQDSSNS